MPGKVRVIDLSVEINQGTGVMGAEIQYISHKDSVAGMVRSFPGIKDIDLPDGLGWAAEQITLGTHSGTHMDAPWHYHPTSGGKKSKTIDEMPLEWAYGDGVVLDMCHKPPGTLITTEDMQAALAKIKYRLKPLDIVLIKTGCDKFWGTPRYLTDYAGASRLATIWLIDQGVKLVGTDAPGWDRPFGSAAKEFRETGNRDVIWEGHYAGIQREYFQMEKLANLDKLPPYGFKVYCFPIKIARASAAWVRPVAIVEG